ncbi:MAG: YhcH/YjgK/YiaL family protein, partial [Oscillospiraceae bacterium]
MIAGSIYSDTEQSLCILPKPLQNAIKFLQDTDLISEKAGRYEIELDGVPVVLQILDITTAPREQLRAEIHRANIDVQFLAMGGPERAMWYPDLNDNEVDEDLLDTPRDILFYRNNSNVRENTIELNIGSYAIYFPWDVHIPAVQVGDVPSNIRKIVLKIPLSACL